MKKMTISKYAIIFLLAIILCACVNKNDKNIIATINGEPINSKISDRAIQQQIYDKLYEIYELRQKAINEYTTSLVLRKEAEALSINADSLLKTYIQKRLSKDSISKFAHKEGYDLGFPKIKDGIYTYINPDEIEWYTEVVTKYKESLRKQFADSLKKKYNVVILLRQPISPQLKLDSIKVFERGNINSPIKITEITDFNCSICRSMHNELERIYNEYKDLICFRYSNFSNEITIAARAAEAASRQDKYWEMRQLLMQNTEYNDTLSITHFAYELDLDMNQFAFDINDVVLINGIDKNNEYLFRKGLYSTPTIMINDHIVRNATNIYTLRNEILRAIKNLDEL